MNRPVFIVTIAVFLASVIVFSHNVSASKKPIAEKGQLDLRAWDFAESGVITPDGEWEFYWNKLLTPDSFRTDPLPSRTGYIAVPGKWNGYLLNGSELSGDGFATYRLQLKLREPNRLYAIKVLDMGYPSLPFRQM